MEETRKSGRNEERERKKGNRSEKGRNKRKIRAMMGKKKGNGKQTRVNLSINILGSFPYWTGAGLQVLWKIIVPCFKDWEGKRSIFL